MRQLYLILIVLLLGCSDDEFKPVFDVPDDLKTYTDTFMKEAAKRGKVIELKNLIIKYDSTIADGFCGNCNSNSLDGRIQKIISLNAHFECWFSDAEKEAFFFHELGHCILGRLHDNALLPSGDPKSLMIQSNLAVYAPCLYPINNEPCDNSFKRPYYLDELFDETTAIPDWGD